MVLSRKLTMRKRLVLVFGLGVFVFGLIYFLTPLLLPVFATTCSPKHFLLPGMLTCHSWLTCQDLESVAVHEVIGHGGMKAVYRAEWHGYPIALSKLINYDYLSDFEFGLKMLIRLAQNPHIVQLVGFCRNYTIILTEFHKYGSAVNLTTVIKSTYKDEDSAVVRVEFCLKYAHLLDMLHNSPIGTRVMCDSNDISKLLSQILVTDNLHLILSDLDALPEINKASNKTVKCGRRQISGDFPAPEQLWPFPTQFDDRMMPGYDEKTDIWKAATVCDHIIGDVQGSEVARYLLFPLHKSCKNRDSRKRPTAKQMIEYYEKTLEELRRPDL